MGKPTAGKFTGERLSDYLIVGNLRGSGAFGEVYEVQNQLLIRRVNSAGKLAGSREHVVLTTLAVKIFQPEAELTESDDQISGADFDPKSLPKLLVELDLALSLNHPHCTRSFSGGRATFRGQQHVFLLMELAGTSLLDILKERDGCKLDLTEALAMAQHIADAVSYCHNRTNGKCFVHRDVKPGNILYFDSAAGEGVCWKLADFGISRLREKADKTRSIIGTESYMPPEAFEGHVGDGWDVWSLGCTLSEALGQKPFSSEPEISRGDGPRFPRDVPDRVLEILRGCLEKDPAKRWKMQKVLEEIREYREAQWLRRMAIELRRAVQGELRSKGSGEKEPDRPLLGPRGLLLIGLCVVAAFALLFLHC